MERWSEARLLTCLLVFGVLVAAIPRSNAQNNPVPMINNPVVPSAAVPGGPGFTLTVNGTGFVSGSVVNWNGSPRATHFVNQSQVTASILSSDVARATTASVTVTNPAPGGGTSNLSYFSVTLAKSTVPFSTTVTGVGGKGGGTIAFGDFNRDGKVDVAILGDLKQTLVVLLGNGDGTFQRGIPVQLPHVPEFLVAADFNGDGNLDLAMSELNTIGQVEVLLGNGDGTFQSAQSFTTGQGQGSAIVAADLNADGALDLIIANQNNASISVLLGNGDGTFRNPVNTSVGSSPVFIGVGDFNNDGKLDLAVVDGSGFSVFILLGNGDGSFLLGPHFLTDQSPLWIATGDFNHDGKLDLAVVVDGRGNTGSVQVFLGNGDGTFQDSSTYASGPFTYGQMVAADINADGNLDLVVAIECLNTCTKWGVATLLGNEDGTFQPMHLTTTPAAPFYLGAADVNGDGSIDIVGSTPASGGGLLVMLQTPAIFAPGNLSFGATVVGTSGSPLTTTLTNVGAGPLVITGVSVGGANAGDFSQTNNCPSSLAQGASCAINVTFAPTATGTRTAVIRVGDSGAPKLSDVTLKGVGKAADSRPR